MCILIYPHLCVHIDNVKTPHRSRNFFSFKTINMGQTIPCSGHTAKEVDFMYSTKFTFLNLNLFKGAQSIISVPNVTTFLPCNIETLLIFFLTPLTIFIVLCSNRKQTCYILVISYSPQQSTINTIIFPYLSMLICQLILNLTLKKKQLQGNGRNNISQK